MSKGMSMFKSLLMCKGLLVSAWCLMSICQSYDKEGVLQVYVMLPHKANQAPARTIGLIQVNNPLHKHPFPQSYSPSEEITICVFEVFSVTQSRIDPRSITPKANTLPTVLSRLARLLRRFRHFFKDLVMSTESFSTARNKVFGIQIDPTKQ